MGLGMVAGGDEDAVKDFFHTLIFKLPHCITLEE